MNRTYAFAGIAVLAVAAGAYATFGTHGIVGADVRLALFSTGSTTRGILYVPIEADRPAAHVSVIIDGTAAGESVIPVRDGTHVGIPVALSVAPSVGASVEIAVDGEYVTRELSEVVREGTDLLELHKVTRPEESMKFGIKMVFAKEPVTEAGRITPDIGQKIAECAPTSAANSIISLAEEHGMEDKLPPDEQIINELKGEMDWTPENGVLPPDFVEGKNTWMAKHGLPIRTTIVGSQHGIGTLEAILDAMASGAAAEIRMKFADKKGKVTGGHMVTITGVRTAGGETFIDVSDPRTPEGTDVYKVKGNIIEGYPYDGIAVLSWGFVQTWEDPTGVALDPMTDAEIKGIQNAVGQKETIKVITYKGKMIPLSELHVGKGDHCDSVAQSYPHYHTNNGSAKAVDGTLVPDNDGCGFGKVKDVPVEDYILP